jgi:hypothetical protein
MGVNRVRIKGFGRIRVHIGLLDAAAGEFENDEDGEGCRRHEPKPPFLSERYVGTRLIDGVIGIGYID